jgi:glycosyltransferase involved in cell wall biosynthesis
MASYRLAIVTPRFWPLVGDSPSHLLQLAASLRQLGHQPMVVTPRWKRAWPQEMQIGDVPLVRLRGAPRGGWATLRWMYSLAAWLRDQQRLDGILVAGLKHEAYVAVAAARRRDVRLILIAGDDDLAWHRSATLGSRIAARCREAPTIVAPCAAMSKALIGDGYHAARLVHIPRSIDFPAPRTPHSREAARMALASANYDLVTTANTQIALAVGRLDAAHRFGDLVRAWRIVTARRGEARLWIVGDGPDRDALHRQIGDLDQRFRVLLPGTFDSQEELMQTADILLAPGGGASPPRVMLEALAHGIAVVTADGAAARECVEHEQTGLVYPSGEVKSLAAAVLRLIESPADAIRLGAAARTAALSRLSPALEAQAYLKLIE